VLPQVVAHPDVQPREGHGPGPRQVGLVDVIDAERHGGAERSADEAVQPRDDVSAVGVDGTDLR